LNNSGSFSSVVTGLAQGRTYYYRAVALNPTGGGRSVNGSISSFVTAGGGPAPVPGVPVFVWLIIGGFVIVIIIVIILLASRR